MSDIEVIVGVDPGVITGLCRIYPAVGYEASWAMDQFESCTWIHTAAKHYGPKIVFAYEMFVPRKGTFNFKSESLEVIGVIRWVGHEYGCHLAPQLVSDAKAFADNARLRQLDWWNPGGTEHERDAARHVLLFLARIGRYDGTTVKWGTTNGTSRTE